MKWNFLACLEISYLGSYQVLLLEIKPISFLWREVSQALSLLNSSLYLTVSFGL